MRQPQQTYKLANLGAFSTLDDKDFNNLCCLELNLLHAPCILYIKQGYSYIGNEPVLSDKEFQKVLESTTSDLLN